MTDHPHPLAGAVKLKPCPFCGGNNIGWDWREGYSCDSSYAFFGCLDCNIGMDNASEHDVSHPEDVAAWNRRALSAPTPPADVAGLVERLLIVEEDPEQIYMGDGLYNVCKEGADALTTLSARVAELEALAHRLTEERDRALEWRDHDKERAEAAEVLADVLERILARADRQERAHVSIGIHAKARAFLADFRAMKGKP